MTLLEDMTFRYVINLECGHAGWPSSVTGLLIKRGFFFFFYIFRAALAAYGGCQARG